MRKLCISLTILLCLALITACGGGAAPEGTAKAPDPTATAPVATAKASAAPTVPAPTPTPEPAPEPTPEPTPETVIETGIEPGMRAPDFTLEQRGGGEVSVQDLRGKPVFINIFATWCGPCVREMPDIQKVYEQYGDRVHFLAIDVGEEKSLVDEFLDEYGFTFPVAYDYDGEVSDVYGAMYIPLTYMLDDEGIIMAAVNESTDEKTMTALIEEALAR